MLEVDLVVVGNLLIDDLPHDPASPGGAALFAALAARCCGLSVGVHSVVGTDYPLHWLEEAGVQLSLQRLDGPSGRTVIRYRPEGRTLERRGPDHRTLSPTTFHPFRAKMVHVAPMPTDIQAFHLSNCAPQSALLDPFPWLDRLSWQAFCPLRDRIAALLVNDEELRISLDELNSDVWVVHKQGARGGVTRNPVLSWQAASMCVVDQTGAGDSFAAGLAAGLCRGESKSQALEQAVLAAGWALSGAGASELYRRAALAGPGPDSETKDRTPPKRAWKSPP